MAGAVIASPSVTLADANGGQTIESTPDTTTSTSLAEKPDPTPQTKANISNTPVAKIIEPGYLDVTWQGDSLVASWQGSCVSPVTMKIGAENWGYLPEPKDGIQAISGASSGSICDPDNGGGGVSIPLSQAVCYGFTKAWIQVDGKTDDAGLKVLEIPSSISCSN